MGLVVLFGREKLTFLSGVFVFLKNLTLIISTCKK